MKDRLDRSGSGQVSYCIAGTRRVGLWVVSGMADFAAKHRKLTFKSRQSNLADTANKADVKLAKSASRNLPFVRLVFSHCLRLLSCFISRALMA